ncbi:MAG: c-type cytochrome [Pseudorhodobacter sp.]|nr:c-type cytochrome [Pseudorhodobacter sp.]
MTSWQGRFLPGLALAATLNHGSSVAADTIGDPARGAEMVQSQCAACHEIGIDATSRIGRVLKGIYGRRAASVHGFEYSRSMHRMGKDGLTWTLETLDPYFANPKALVSGTKMAYKGLRDDAVRHDLLAFLRDWSDKPGDIPEAEPTARRSLPEPAPAIPSIMGDRDFGQYLSAECATCHRHDGSDLGIPSITHWPVEDFVAALRAYKQKLRPHPVMQMMAGRLTNDEIAALAAYFAAID